MAGTSVAVWSNRLKKSQRPRSQEAWTRFPGAHISVRSSEWHNRRASPVFRALDCQITVNSPHYFVAGLCYSSSHKTETAADRRCFWASRAHHRPQNATCTWHSRNTFSFDHATDWKTK